MTAPYSPPVAARHPVQGVRCLRCHVLQPPLPPGHFTCVTCGAVLPLQRWVAHPPVGTPADRRPRRSGSASPRTSLAGYAGPPSYRGGPPRWGFPASVWQPRPEARADARTDAGGPEAAARRALRGAAVAAWVTAGTALLAAGAETWRFVLMLQGRRVVLSGSVVTASDVLVAAAGLAVVVAALGTFALASIALARTSPVAAARAGQAPPRTTRAVLARLLVPGWNLYGAGQVLAEIDAMLRSRDRPHDDTPSGTSAEAHANGSVRRPSALVVAWWAAWAVNAGLVVAAVARGFDGNLQAVADTVELHIAVDLAAAVTATLGGLLLWQFRDRLADAAPGLGRWVVQPPPPTR